MFTDFPKIMVWHFHVPETQMSGMINFLHHRQNSRLIGFRDIKITESRIFFHCNYIQFSYAYSEIPVYNRIV